MGLLMKTKREFTAAILCVMMHVVLGKSGAVPGYIVAVVVVVGEGWGAKITRWSFGQSPLVGVRGRSPLKLAFFECCNRDRSPRMYFLVKDDRKAYLSNFDA